jgi:hypothetical protein
MKLKRRVMAGENAAGPKLDVETPDFATWTQLCGSCSAHGTELCFQVPAADDPEAIPISPTDSKNHGRFGENLETQQTEQL